jgi:hypothetical protein
MTASVRTRGYLVAGRPEFRFPTDLDADPPVDGLAPASQADLMRRALAERLPGSALAEQLARWTGRRGTGR